MAHHLHVLSLWRGVIPVRRTLAALADELDLDPNELRKRSRTLAKDEDRRRFVDAAFAEGAGPSEVARFLGRSTHGTYRRRARARS